MAADYSAHVFHELDGKPLDRALLDEVATRAGGLICDLGCGPGHVARYLSERGAEVCGVDLSPGMIDEACRLNPGLRFEVGDMRSLGFADGSLGGVVAMYSLIHLARDGIAVAAAEVRRVLAPGGVFLGGFHRGVETRRVDEWWGHEVDLEFHFFEPEEIVAALTPALRIDRVVTRDPYPDVEVETRRFYVLAVRPGAPSETTSR
jgi:SAM-dependent methyltransferase